MSGIINRKKWLLGLSLLISGCGGHVYHVVEPGETLYSISWIYGYDYREIAKWNGIPEPYHVHSGQRIRVAMPNKGEWSAVPPSQYIAKAENKVAKAVPQAQVSRESSVDSTSKVSWQWPTKGKVINYFSSSKLNKGIDIAGERGQDVVAAAGGKVVYSGTGLVGMGKLVIINHSPTYLSAYAHNEQILVKEGQQVKKGELIAQMGSSGADQVILHFEIRREGKPVNPLKLLPGPK